MCQGVTTRLTGHGLDCHSNISAVNVIQQHGMMLHLVISSMTDNSDVAGSCYGRSDDFSHQQDQEAA